MALNRIIKENFGLMTSEVFYDADEDRLVSSQTQEVDPLLDLNKAEYNDFQGYKSEVMNHAASIPLNVVYKWMQEGLNIFDTSPETEKRLKQKLNSAEYRYLRTMPGKL